jgi:hypothetical protein
MNSWSSLIQGPEGAALRDVLCEAAAVAHTENAARFDPDELGDDALIYGLATTINARFIAARAVEEHDELGNVTVCERGRAWWLEVQRPGLAALRLFFYKAPPAASSVYDLRLDDAEIKRELSTTNGRQLELFNRRGGVGNVELLNLVVLHYGEPATALTRVDVGAPYLDGDAIAWDWFERFDELGAESVSAATVSPLGEDADGFADLALVVSEPDQSPPSVAVEPATSEFDALRLRHDSETAGRGTDEGQG